MDRADASNNNRNEENSTVGAASIVGAADAADATTGAVAKAFGTVDAIVLHRTGASNNQDASSVGSNNTGAKIYYL